MLRQPRHAREASLFAILLAIAWLAGCTEQPTMTVAPTRGGFSISPGQLTLTAIDDTARFTAMDIPDGSTEPVAVGGATWSSSDTSVAVVDGNGLVTAIGSGVAVISGSSGIETDQAAAVVSQVPARVDIQPSALTLSTLGASAQLTAHAYDRTGHEIPSTDIRWSSTDTTVVSVSSDGTITARRNGAAQILATVVGWPQSPRRLAVPGVRGPPGEATAAQ